MIQFLTDTPWLAQVSLVLGGIILGFAAERVCVRWLGRLAKGTDAKWDDAIIRSIHWMPMIWFVSAGIYFAVLFRGVDPAIQQLVLRGVTVVVILSIVVVGWRFVGVAFQVLAGRSQGILPSTTLVTNLARVLVAVLGGFIILQNLDVEITPLIGALGIVGLAVALALQDTLGNLFAGLQIIFSRQVRPQDYVRLETGEEGFVTDVKGRNTTIRTFPDHNLVIVPNATLASSTVTNFSLPRRNLWIGVDVGVSYDSDLEQVERVALDVASDVMASVEGGIHSQVPVVRFEQFGASSIDFTVRMFVKEFTDQVLIRHEFIKRLHTRFNREGIEIPFPQRTLHVSGSQPAPLDPLAGNNPADAGGLARTEDEADGAGRGIEG